MESTELENLKGKNWVATMMLCWALGAFGAHRYYTGKKGTAIVMTIMTASCVCAIISMIWAVIDGICIALGVFTHNDGSELYERVPWLGYTYIGIIILSVLAFIGYLILFIGLAALIGSSLPSAIPPVTP